MGDKRDPARRGVLTDLNEISDELLQELRSVGGQLEAESLFRHYAAPQCRRFARTFVMDVVIDGNDAVSWRRGGVLAPSWGLHEMLTRSPHELLAPIAAVGSVVDARVPARRAAFDRGSDLVGAPAVHRPDLDYRWQTKPNLSRLVTGYPTEALGDLEVAVRRWIAARLAMILLDNGGLSSAESPEEMVERAGIDRSRATPDALCAAAGLLGECESIQADPTLVPGFVGRDELYR